MDDGELECFLCKITIARVFRIPAFPLCTSGVVGGSRRCEGDLHFLCCGCLCEHFPAEDRHRVHKLGKAVDVENEGEDKKEGGGEGDGKGEEA